jgi:hypothetical protein
MCVVLTRIYPTFKCIDRIDLSVIRSVLIIVLFLLTFQNLPVFFALVVA